MNNLKEIMGIATAIMLLTACVPRIEVAPSKDPIVINMNVKIEHEINIKVDRDVEQLLKAQSDIF